MSNKIVDGVELLRMIRDGELKQDQEMIDINKNKKYYFDGACIIGKEEFEMLLSNITDVSFSRMKFRILSAEDEEIDIDSITEIYINDIKSVGESETKCWTGRNLDIAFANKINDLIKAIKQLNNKINKEKL